MTTLNSELIKQKQLNRVLVMLFMLNLMACGIFLYQFGFSYSARSAIHYTVTALFGAMCLVRHFLSLKTKLAFLIAYGLVTTTAGLLYVGTMSVSLSLFTIIIVFTALYFTKRQVYLILGGILAIFGLIGYLFTQGLIAPKLALNLLIVSPIYWASFIVLSFFCFLIIHYTVFSYRRRISELHGTIERQNVELLKLIATDPLTGMASTRLVDERLEMTVKHCDRYQSQAAVLFIDIDNFKFINDTYGHAAGDFCLKTTAKRLAASVQEVDTVARLGGDEFLIVIEQLGARGELDALLDRMLKAIREPMLTDSCSIKITCSIGVAIIPEHGRNIDQLKSRADKAMYQAKRYGKNQYFVENLIDIPALVEAQIDS